MLTRVLTLTHPRLSTAWVQLAVLLAAVGAGVLIGVVLLSADRSSWAGSVRAEARVTGVSHDGVTAIARGRQVTLHLSPVPQPGRVLQVEVSPDGRARPVEFVQTPARAIRQGLTLAVLLTVLVQAYRFVVTRRAGRDPE